MRSEVEAQAIVIDRSRLADYLTLSKPELTLLSVITALAGVFLASPGSIALGSLLHVFIGTMLVGSGAGALNQLIEREYDGLMRRTEHRPLPSGRLLPLEVLIFGIVTSAIGILDLAVFTNLLTAFLAIVTIVTYLFLYTPLKRITPWSTLVGGIPGALPPIIGWAAVRNEITTEAWLLFAILFFWQMPHFFSLAWMYRKDYEKGGYRMLTVVDPTGEKTSAHVLVYSCCLFVASVIPFLLGFFGAIYFVAALLLGIAFIATGVNLRIARTNDAARKVFFASLAYLPVLVLFMVVDRL